MGFGIKKKIKKNITARNPINRRIPSIFSGIWEQDKNPNDRIHGIGKSKLNQKIPRLYFRLYRLYYTDSILDYLLNRKVRVSVGCVLILPIGFSRQIQNKTILGINRNLGIIKLPDIPSFTLYLIHNKSMLHKLLVLETEEETLP